MGYFILRVEGDSFKRTDFKLLGGIWSQILLKVTVQFETEGNGQNEIFSHMDRSEVKL